MVRWAAVLVTRFQVMMSYTEWLPVALVPEQLLVATVRHDMVHHGCLGVTPLLYALHAQRMLPEVGFAYPLPFAGVATAGCGASRFWMERTVLVTVLFPTLHQLWAAGMPTRMLRFVRHPDHSPLKTNPLKTVPIQRTFQSRRLS